MIDKGQEQERRLCVPVMGSRRQGAGFPLPCKSRKNFSVVDGWFKMKENKFSLPLLLWVIGSRKLQGVFGKL